MAEGFPFIVVVVDHDPAVRATLSGVLRDSRYAVLECEKGEAARSLLGEYPWDLAIVELNLPDLDGAALCEELKANPHFESRYVIVTLEDGEKEESIQVLDRGADDIAVKPLSAPELLAKIRAGKRVVDLGKRLMVLNKELEVLSITDGLTKLYNRRYFQDQLLRAFDQSFRYRRPLSVLLVDIDEFKGINDRYGHTVGDRVLEEVSTALAQSARSTDLVARYGGDEFAIVAPETNAADAYQFAERIRRRVASSAVVEAGVRVEVRVSIGVSSAPDDEFRNAMQMIDLADRALYRAKENGRNRVEIS
jgi:two-component system, cell cycle response regulator